MIDFLESIIKSFDLTIINSRMNELNESDKKIIDSLDKLNEFLKSYKEMNPIEQQNFSNLVGQISYNVGSLTILLNKMNQR